MKVKKFILFFFLSLNSLVYSQSDIDLLPEDPRKILVIKNCIMCHSAKLIAQNSMSKDAWQNIILYMQEKHNLRQLPPGDEQKIVSYLSQYFSPKVSHGIDGDLGPRAINPLP